MNRALRILLTGGIGSGKSTVAALFAAKGVPVVDADEVSRRLSGPGTEVARALVERFGAAILDAGGGIDRARLAAVVFADEAERAWLEALLHPAVYAELAQTMATWPPRSYGIACIPLLLETGQANRGDRVLVVDVPEALQIERAGRRDGRTDEAVAKIMAAQLPRSRRLVKADDIIDNSGGWADLQPQVDALHQRYLDLAQGHDSRSAESGEARIRTI